ncbi:phosphoribosyltransferase [Catalinimonas niigatensis]|uniref:phosphoribosyltransferase n=1 Tax=Catalinimonas niigatensis TaxID=1397264 RepID=UPI0026662C2A|nr:phosphoribosyltransferase family protein [Catalinimonas niigatensis]WPP49796.1 phosphoribosyltransferase family protein [Catalinimonas niigatensis]
MKYLHRNDAAQQLMKALYFYKQEREGIVLALPRGGVPIGKYISDHLHWPLDVAIVKKIKHPLYPELAIGAVSNSGYIINRKGDVSEDYIENEIHQLEKLIKEKYILYKGSKKPLNLKHKIVMLVDDGMATGSTMLAAVAFVKKESPKKTVVAVPVASQEAYRKILRKADAVICLQVSSNFLAVGQFYEEFSQVTDEEVIDMLH